MDSMTPDIASLMSDVSFWEFWGYVALAAVLIGVAGEFIEEFTDWPRHIGCEKGIKRLSALILIAGLAGEGITQPNTNAATATLVALLNKKSGELAIDLDKERNACIAILAQLRPRDVTKPQMTAIANPIRGRFPTVYLYPLSDPNSSRYTFAIAETFKAAGTEAKLMLARDEKTGVSTFPDKFDVPVGVEGVTAYDPPSWGPDGFVDTITRAFRDAGIIVAGENTEKPFQNMLLPAIFIGRKPEPFEQFPAYAMPPELEKFLREHPPAWEPK